MTTQRRLRRHILVVAAVALVTPANVFGRGLTVTGYADFEASVANLGSDGDELSFDNATLR